MGGRWVKHHVRRVMGLEEAQRPKVQWIKEGCSPLDLMFNGLKKAVLLFTYKKIARRDLVILVHFLSLWGSVERPMGDRSVMRHLRRVMG